MRVLIFEGQNPKAATLIAFLKAEGLVVECATDGEDALAILRYCQFDITILNRDIADMEASLLISRIRTAGHHTPIIALLEAGNPKQRLAALCAGADDVVDYDADRAELLARMRAIVRRSMGYSQPIIRRGRLALDQERNAVTLDGERVHFTQKEFALLQLLMMRKSMVMTKEVILSNLYGGMDQPEIKIIDVFVCKVRQRLAKAGLRDVIQTVWGRGYVVRDESRDEKIHEPCTPLPIEVGRPELQLA